MHSGEDNFSGRLSYTIEIVWQLNAADWLGISNNADLLVKSVDSGIVYLVMTQSIIGVTMIWCMITASRKSDSPERLGYVLGVAIYVSLVCTVSYSLLSIKTSAFLWFVFGALTAATPLAAEDLAHDPAHGFGAAR